MSEIPDQKDAALFVAIVFGLFLLTGLAAALGWL